MAEEQRFIWSDYSSDASDRGVETTVTWRGETIPIRVKRALTRWTVGCLTKSPSASSRARSHRQRQSLTL